MPTTTCSFLLLHIFCFRGKAIRLTHMSKASLADDEPQGGDSKDMTSRIYAIIRDYGEIFVFFFIFSFFVQTWFVSVIPSFCVLYIGNSVGVSFFLDLSSIVI